jgi:hypothetical protein
MPGCSQPARPVDHCLLHGSGTALTTERLAGRMLAIAAVLACVGCASQSILIKIDPNALTPQSEGLRRSTQVEVIDIRERKTLSRTSMGVYLSEVRLEPDEAEIIRSLVQAKVDQLAARSAGDLRSDRILVGIRTFDISTPSTALYWDVTASIEVVVRIADTDRGAAGSATERTYLWPSQSLITRVTYEALRTLGEDLESALLAPGT